MLILYVLVIIDKQFSVEIDIWNNNNNNIILLHDPFNENNCDLFENYLQKYNNDLLILNIKSERLELKCIELLEKYNINNYFFLDSSISMIYLLYNKYNNNIAYRFSEYEPIEFYYNIKNMIKYI